MAKFLLHLLALVPQIFALSHTVNQLSLDYFKFKNVQHICLLHCDHLNWLASFAKSSTYTSLKISSINIKTGPGISKKLSKCLDREFTSLGVLIDTTCSNFEQVLYLASTWKFFDSEHYWLIIHNEDDLISQVYETGIGVEVVESEETVTGDGIEMKSPLINVLDKLNVSIDCDVIVAVNKGDTFKIYDIFSFGKEHGGLLNITTAGSWNITTGLILRHTGYKYIDRWDFNDLVLRMIVVSSNPKNVNPEKLSSVLPDPDLNNGLKMGYILLDKIAENHNFRFNILATDTWVGTYVWNSSKAAADYIYFNEADITPAIRMFRDLTEKFCYLHPHVSAIQTKYFYRIPTSGIGKFENKFFIPFTTNAWICIGVVCVLCICVLFMAASFEQRPSLVQYAVFNITASVCQQFFESNDTSETPRASSARKVTLLVTGISCLIVYNYYTSSVVSWLLHGAPPAINSLKELLDSPLELIFEDVGYTRSWLKEVPGYYFTRKNAKIEEEIRRRKVLNNRNRKIPLTMSLEEGVDMLKVGDYAFHAQVDSAKNRISATFDKRQLCELGAVESMEKSLIYAILQKNSPYKEFFIWSLARLHERGHISQAQRSIASPDISCDGSVPQALALGGAAPAFIILASGFVVSIIVLVGEIASQRYHDH